MSILIVINKAGSYQNLDLVKDLVRDTWKLDRITMLYKPDNGLPPLEFIDDYPCSLFFTDTKTGEDILIRIYSLTCGYGGSGPNDFISLLDHFNINYDEEDILTKKKIDSSGWIYLIYKP